MANIYNMSDTWNDGATTFTSIKMNVTDTASASGSLLMDLQVGGVSLLRVSKSGNVLLTAGSEINAGANSRHVFSSASQTFHAGGRSMTYDNTGQLSLTGGGNQSIFSSSIKLGDRTLPTSSAVLSGEAANTLGQRNSTNAQTFNIYNTYTDGSNYERGFMKWNSNVLEIGAEAAGTGTTRISRLILNGTANRVEGSTNQVRIFAGGGEYLRVGIGTWSMPLWANAAGLKIETVNQTGNLDRNGDPIIIDCKGGSGAGTPGYISFKTAKSLASGTTGHTSTEVMRISQNTSDQSVVTITSLPTSDPVNAGQLWNDAGTLKISAG